MEPRVIFIDEGHHATAATWEKVIARWPKAYKIFLTATPARLDDKGLGNLIDHLVIGPQIRELVPEFLAKTRVFSVPTTFDMTRATLKAQSEQQTGAVIARSVETWAKFARERKSLFFAVDVEHSKAITTRLLQMGVAACHLDHKTPDRERERKLNEIWAGKYQCVSNVNLFTEGTDWPECSCVVLARGTGSLVQYRQMNGRAMRRKEDGGDAVIIDLAGNVHVHGMPDEDIEWSLEYGVEESAKKGLKDSVRRCEWCQHMYPRVEPECPLVRDGAAQARGPGGRFRDRGGHRAPRRRSGAPGRPSGCSVRKSSRPAGIWRSCGCSGRSMATTRRGRPG